MSNILLHKSYIRRSLRKVKALAYATSKVASSKAMPESAQVTIVNAYNASGSNLMHFMCYNKHIGLTRHLIGGIQLFNECVINLYT